MNALEQVEQIARKYELNSVSGTIEKIRNTASIKIAFLGEFSAGKSSLINSILGTHLPTDILPTTKAICLIEPTEGITETEYFKETDGIRSSVSFGEFSEIVSGEKEDVAGMLIAPCKVLPMGSIFIDTPGFHTAVGKEAQQTFSYLSMIDAAVLCINIAEGVINAQVMDFLTDQAFSMIQNHIVFALTGSDRKSPVACERIRESIIKQLEKAVSEGKLSIDNIPDKVFTVSAKDKGNAEKVYGVIEKAILKDHAAICAQRQETDTKKVAADCIGILRELIKVTTFDPDKIDEEIREQKRKMDALSKEIYDREDKLDSFTFTLQSRIASHMKSNIPAIQSAESDAEKAACIQRMNESLFDMLNAEAQTYLKIAQIPPEVCGMMSDDILSRLQTVNLIKDVSVTIGTAVLTAWAAPAGGASNLLEAGAGAAIQRSASSAADDIAEGIGTVSKSSKFFGTIGKVLRDLNPLEKVGSIVSLYIGKNVLENMVAEKSASIALQVTSALEEPYKNDVLDPLMNQLQEENRVLDSIRLKGDQEFDKFKAKQAEINADIITLQSIV